jgi:hypothetical protein
MSKHELIVQLIEDLETIVRFLKRERGRWQPDEEEEGTPLPDEELAELVSRIRSKDTQKGSSARVG